MFVGGINAIIGVLGVSHKSFTPLDQDYTIVPGPKLLYNVKGLNNTVRQFVATQPGFGYNVEEQITGTNEENRRVPMDCLASCIHRISGGKTRKPQDAHPKWEIQRRQGNTNAKAPGELGLLVGDEFNLQQRPVEAIMLHFLPYSTEYSAMTTSFSPAAASKGRL